MNADELQQLGRHTDALVDELRAEIRGLAATVRDLKAHTEEKAPQRSAGWTR